ncbi:hypothetical protein, partial [Micromonospora tulbaghiae]|uniref:hypothetical protein n=1 Tax=Micromonospora tulbaghiae TaxID=479978 RepID=UPI001FCA097C
LAARRGREDGPLPMAPGLGGTALAGEAEVAGARVVAAVPTSVGVAGVARVTAGDGDAGWPGDGSRCSVLGSTNGMTVSGVIGPPAKLTPTMTV